MRTLLIAAGVAALVAAPAQAQEEPFDTEKMIEALDERLKLTHEELEKMKPALELKSQEFRNSISESLEQGFAEFEELSREFDIAAQRVQEQLQDALDGQEMQELRGYLERLDAEALESIRQALLEEMTNALELTQEQIEKLRPVLLENLERLSELLRRFAAQTEKSFADFRRDYEQLQEQTRRRLEESLDADQIEAFEKRQEELRERIRALVFGEG